MPLDGAALAPAPMLAASPAAAAAVALRRINERRLSCASPITLSSSADVASAFFESIMPSIPFWLRNPAILLTTLHCSARRRARLNASEGLIAAQPSGHPAGRSDTARRLRLRDATTSI